MTIRAQLCAVVAALAGAGAVRAAEAGPAPEDYPAGRVVRYSFTVENTGPRALTNAQLWAYAPVRQTAYQRCDALETSHPYERVGDARGNQVLHFRLPPLAPGAGEVVTVTALLGMRHEPMPGLAPEPGDTGAEPLVEIDDPEFRERAPRFEDGDALERARAIFDWTARHLPASEYVRADLGALDALRGGRGDCTESACLFVALCRLHGIPARVLGGYRTRGGVLDPEHYHNWAEFHDGRTWRLADAHARVFDRDAASYVVLRVAGSRESPVNPFPQFRGDGEGLEVTMNRP